jgi:hypothetical protein
MAKIPLGSDSNCRLFDWMMDEVKFGVPLTTQSRSVTVARTEVRLVSYSVFSPDSERRRGLTAVLMAELDFEVSLGKITCQTWRLRTIHG